MNRFRQLKKNMGWGGVLRTVLLGSLCVGAAIYGPDSTYFKPVVLAALFLPALLSKSFAKSPGPWSNVINKAAWALFLVAFVGPQIRDQVNDIPEIVTVLWGTIALYIGFFFWFWSHPEVISLEED